MFRATHRVVDADLHVVRPNCDPKSLMKLSQLMSCGAMFEDIPGVRSFSHFHDPVHNAPLTVNGRKPGEYVPPGNANLTSADWALQDNNNIPDQRFSYRRAREYFFNALTLKGPAGAPDGRNDHWALLFQSLGHVIHHVQDMAQPQHTRNDPHADWLIGVFGMIPFGELRHPSRFEKHSRNRGVAEIARSLVGPLTPVYPRFAQKFKTPRSFWIEDDVGLANFTNRNFVSHGTNYVADIGGIARPSPDFALPAPSSYYVVNPLDAFAPNSVPESIAMFCEDGGILNCDMAFYANQWVDPLTGTSMTNSRSATVSVFDEDLNRAPISFNTQTGAVIVSKVSALNTINFDAAYPFLIPKAVEYSAGLINYFFRGKMEIGLPADGIYSLVDHHAHRCKDACGFKKFKLKVKNTTPGEDMTAGTLRAAVKFHRNNCYREDLGGDPGGPAFAGISCRSAEEEAFVSDPMPVTMLGTLEERELTFTFPNTIPINATDLYLQVVFQGKLGEEPGAVAVATKDISEPNYFAFTNITDKAYDFGDHAFHSLPYRAFTSPDSIYGVSVAFRDGAAPLAQIAQLDAANHAQLAFLTDTGRQYLDIRYSSHRYTVGSPIRGTIPVSEFVANPALSTYGRNVAFTFSRGMYRNYFEYHRIPADFTTYDCRVEVELCAQSTMTPFTPASAVEWAINF